MHFFYVGNSGFNIADGLRDRTSLAPLTWFLVQNNFFFCSLPDPSRIRKLLFLLICMSLQLFAWVQSHYVLLVTRHNWVYCLYNQRCDWNVTLENSAYRIQFKELSWLYGAAVYRALAGTPAWPLAYGLHSITGEPLPGRSRNLRKFGGPPVPPHKKTL